MRTNGYRVNSPRISHETIDGEVVVIDFEDGAYFSLRHVAGDIWSLILSRVPPADMAEALALRYDGDPKTIAESVERFLGDLEREHLIVPDEGEAPAREPAPEAAADPAAVRERAAFSPPVLEKFTDMQDLLLLDPIHEVDERGWPAREPDRPRE